jgi:hypothetical protein
LKPLRYVAVRWNENELPRLPADYRYKNGKPGEAIQPKVIFGHDAIPQAGQTKIAAFADWMVSAENPRFSTVVANRMFKKVFGMGLIEPVDEITDSTVASNPQLMDYLTQLVADEKFDLRNFLRVLYNTETYQRMASKEEVALGDTYHFTGPMLRRMGAEQIWDSLVVLTRGNVDGEVSEENQQLHRYLGNLKYLTESLQEKGRSGLVEAAKRSNAEHEENMKRIEEQRAKAQASGDKEAMKEIAAEANRMRRETSREMLIAIVGEERAHEFGRGGYGKKGGKSESNQLTDEQKAALAALSKEERQAAIKMGSSMNLTHRASEISSPAKPGHFLRTFGQSDRELIQNANDDASVPQALAMLNGPVSQALSNPTSRLSAAMAKAGSTDEKVDAVYMSLLSRMPTAQEKEVLHQVIADRGDKAPADIVHALLTGSQFLYIQ